MPSDAYSGPMSDKNDFCSILAACLLSLRSVVVTLGNATQDIEVENPQAAHQYSKKTLLFFETSPRRIQRLIHLRPAVALAEHAVPTQLVHLAAAAPLAAAALLVAAQLVGPVVHAAPDMIIDISSPRCVS